MMTSPMSHIVQHLRKDVLLREGADLTDGQLLESFVSRRDAAVLEVLVQRHAAMVWGVCRRILPHHQDAEDAFQATFLVLARKAAGVVPREAVGNWLYGVACRTALKAKAAAARRGRREKQVMAMPHPSVPPQEIQLDIERLLDQELNGLPDKYRLPLVLCELEGRRRKEVAEQLQLPEGTLSSRLATARRLLAKRLARHGLQVSAGTLAGVLLDNTAAAEVSAPLVRHTVQSAVLIAAGQSQAADLVSAKVAALAEGVAKAMFLTKLKIAVVVLLGATFLGAGLGAGGWIYPAQAIETPEPADESQAKPGPQTAKPEPVKRMPGTANYLAETLYARTLALDKHYAAYQWKCQVCHAVTMHHPDVTVPLDSYHASIITTAADPSRDEMRKLIASVREKDRKMVGKAMTVGAAMRQIESALQRQRQLVPDKETEIQTLDEIEKAVREMKHKLQGKEERKMKEP